MSFWDHLAALRPHLVRSAVAVVVVAVVAFLSKHFLIETVLFGPKSHCLRLEVFTFCQP